MQDFAKIAENTGMNHAHFGNNKILRLQSRLLLFSLFNFFVLTVSGLFLRGVPLFNISFFPYRNILHSHSHFAFSGWVTPALLWMIMSSFPELTRQISYKHWRNIFFILMISTYGMLLSFPWQGYGPVSIFFSTLSIAGTYYFGFLLLTVSKIIKQSSVYFLNAAIFFLVLSSIGPFAVGPLTAAGKAGTPLYFNCIYFYLHFQYNGWFSFVILALLYKKLNVPKENNGLPLSFVLLFTGCVLSIFLSFLWNHPGAWFNVIGGMGAIFQLIGLGYLLYDISGSPKNVLIQRLEWVALIAFILKLILQLLNAFPPVIDAANQYRNFIIAYLHLIMLGFVTLFILSAVVQALPSYFYYRIKLSLYIYLPDVVVSELMLALQAYFSFMGINIPQFHMWIFMVSIAFPVAAFMVYSKTAHILKSEGSASTLPILHG